MPRLAGLVVTTVAVVGALSPVGTWAKSQTRSQQKYHQSSQQASGAQGRQPAVEGAGIPARS